MTQIINTADKIAKLFLSGDLDQIQREALEVYARRTDIRAILRPLLKEYNELNSDMRRLRHAQIALGLDRERGRPQMGDMAVKARKAKAKAKTEAEIAEARRKKASEEFFAQYTPNEVKLIKALHGDPNLQDWLSSNAGKRALAKFNPRPSASAANENEKPVTIRVA